MNPFQSPRLLTPGPTPVPDRIRLAMAQPMIHHRKPEFNEVMAEAQALLRKLFGTSQPVLPLSCSGTGGMTAVAHGLFNPGEKVIVVVAGKFGQRWLEIAEIRGLDIVTIDIPWGQVVTPEQVTQTLDQNPDAVGLLMQISETSTGAMHPVAQVAAITRKRNVLLVADGISAVGISPAPMDQWGIDCLLTGSQKGLMVPPGLALLALSKRAWAKAETVAPSCYYFNLPRERDNCLGNQTLYTSSVSLIVGLREVLRMLFEIGMENQYLKQWALAQMARTGVQALGLETFVPDHYTWGLTSIRMPEDKAATTVVKKAQEECGVIMSAGQSPMKDELLRMGHMGWVDWGDVAAGLHALAWSMNIQTKQPYIELALEAWHDTIKTGSYPSLSQV